MANYTNLESLAGLQVGDVITYTGNNNSKPIDFAKYKCNIVLYGRRAEDNYSNGSNGGKAEFTFDTSKAPSQLFYFTIAGGVCLCYGSSYNLYYRIAVAGNAGEYGYGYSARRYPGGLGGGSIGGTGTNATYNNGMTTWTAYGG